MKKDTNIITLKFKYETSDCDKELIKTYQRDYSSVLRYTYNRVCENTKISSKEITALQKKITNNRCGSHLKNSAFYDAKAVLKDFGENKIIFGSKKAFKLRASNKITKEEWKQKRLRPIYSVGEALSRGNRHFKITEPNCIKVAFRKNENATLTLTNVKRKYKRYLESLKELQDRKAVPITYKLNSEFVCISFDLNKLECLEYKTVENRVIAIDLNPNYIGFTVVDWISDTKYNLIKSGFISFKELNDKENLLRLSSIDSKRKKITNKRKYEIIQASEELFRLCQHYRCEVFAIEQLNIKARDHHNGKRFNRQVNNQWIRNLFIEQIEKRVKQSSTLFVEVQPQYSSQIGNLLYRETKLPDFCLSSIEIGRRGFEFSTQFLRKRRERKRTVVCPDFDKVKKSVRKSMEEISSDVPLLNSWTDVFNTLKNSRLKYRVPLSDVLTSVSPYSESLSMKSIKRLCMFLYFIE